MLKKTWYISELANVFNVVYQQSIFMFDSRFQVCCNWSILKLG